MRTHRIALTALLGLLNSCFVLSIHPFVEEEDAEFDASLVGTWEHRRREGKVETAELEPASGKGYSFIYTVVEGAKRSQFRFRALLTTIQGVRYLDLFPEKEQFEEVPGALWTVPCHQLVRLHETGDSLRFSAMDPDYFGEASDGEKRKVEGVQYTVRKKGPWDAVVLVSGTPELRGFVAKHAAEEGLFGEPGDELKRIRKPEKKAGGN